MNKPRSRTVSFFLLVRLLSVLETVSESRDEAGHDGTKGLLLTILHTLLIYSYPLFF